MKVFTFYSNRFDSASTSIALKQNEIPHAVLVHTEDQAVQFLKNGTVHEDTPIYITGNPPGLAYQRNSALDEMESGEWAVFMCDDFQRIVSYPKEFILSSTRELDVNIQNQSVFRFKKNEHTMSLKAMFEMFPKLIEMAESNNIHLIGFGLHDNPLNLGNKFSFKSLADGRFWLVKKSFYRFDEKVQMIDDVDWTCQNLIHHGKVMVLNWLVPYFKRYTAGGFGSVESRLVQRRTETQYLIKKYSPLVKGAKKPGWPEGTHLKISGAPNNIREARKKLLRIA